MSLSVVHGTVVGPDQTPVPGALVSARLIAPPGVFLLSDPRVELVTAATTISALDGSWTLSLTPQSELAVLDTHYQLRIVSPSGVEDLPIVVPVSATPLPAGTLLVDPATLEPARSYVSVDRHLVLPADVTAAGDLLVATGTGTWAYVPIGTPGQVLTVLPTTPPTVAWADAAAGSPSTDVYPPTYTPSY